MGCGQGGLPGSRGHSEHGCPQAGGRGPGASSLSTDRACGSRSLHWVPAEFQVRDGADQEPEKCKYNVNNRAAEGVKNSAKHFCNVYDSLYNRVEKMELHPLHRRGN